MKNKIISLLGIMLLCSCHESYMTYNAADNGVYLKDSVISYSFGVTPTETLTHMIQIPVYLMGYVNWTSDREFKGEAMSDSTTAQEGVQYTIGSCVIPADSIKGYIPVTIYRKQLAGDYQTGYTYYKLHLRLVSNENFVPTLQWRDQHIMLTFSNAIDQPEWYADTDKSHTKKIWLEGTLGKWHPLKLIKMVEFFHASKQYIPEIYKEMVVEYGENLEHIEAGDTHSYAIPFNVYVYKPMYDFFNDPANKEWIDANYPGFPYDMPNPYK